MTQSGFIAAIDLGSSSIKGVVGRKNENNVISILANGSIPSKNSIRRGMVYNIEETGANVRKLITMLENSLGRKIGKIYVSLGGQSLRTLEFREAIELSPGGIVSDDAVNRLRASAEKYTPELTRAYKVADAEYYIDNKPERNPVGVTGSRLEASFRLITGRPNLMGNVEKSVTGKAELPIADYIVGGLAAAAVALSDEEKELGCAFVDFGAGTTTLSIYKSGILRGMVVIPFGGKNITKDICALNFTESDAEQLKIKFGKAFENQESSFFASPFSSKPDVDLSQLNRVIAMRLDEIVANLKEQIRLSGFEDKLGAGLIITGGASQLKNMEAYLNRELKMPVRRAVAKKTFINNSPELVNDPAFTRVLGMLLLGQENCELQVVERNEQDELDKEEQAATASRLGRSKEKKKESTKTKKQRNTKEGGGFFSNVEDFFGNMFSDDDE